MNGLNRKRKKFKIKIIISIFIYSVLTLALIVSLLNINHISDYLLEKKVVKIKKELETSSFDQTKMKETAQLIGNQELIQLVIKKDNNLVYSNMPISEADILKQAIAKEFIYYSSEYQLGTSDNTYDVYMLVYNKTNNQLINQTITIVLLVFIVFGILMAYLIRVFTNMFLDPLDNLESNLKKMKAFKFDDVISTEEKVNIFLDELKDFAHEIKTKSKDFGVVYSNLEKELLINQEQKSYKKQIVTSLVHDLKTPINIIKLQSMKIEKDKMIEPRTITSINENADVILGDVNEILKVVNDELQPASKETFNLVPELKHSISLFSKLFKEKNLWYSFEMIKDAEIYANKIEIKSIINNALSNIYNHAINDSEVVISIDQQADEYILYFYNEVEDVNKINFATVFDFLVGDKDNENSTGIGLYVVKNFSEKNNGTCTFFPDGNGVALQINLPILKEENINEKNADVDSMFTNN